MITQRQLSELLLEIEDLKQQLEEAKRQCDEHCRNQQIKQLIAEYDIPSFLLETDYTQEKIAKGDVDGLRKILLHRCSLLKRKPKIVSKEK